MNTAHVAAIDPQCIIALEWLPVELLLALGITPYGIIDIPNYRLQVSEPPLPDSAIDVGLHTEPNPELLVEMKSSFLLWSTGYGPSPEKLARIASGRGFNFGDGKKPLAIARQLLQEMAQLLNLQASTKHYLTEYDRLIVSLKPRFIRRGARPVLLTSSFDSQHMLVFGSDSLPQNVLNEYGILNAWQGGTDLWDSTIVGIDRLAVYKDIDVLCFDYGNDEEMAALMSTSLQQAMSFVRNGRFQCAPAAWFYGATLSAVHFARIPGSTLGGKA